METFIDTLFIALLFVAATSTTLLVAELRGRMQP